MNASLARFSESVDCQMTNALAENEPMYKPGEHPSADPVEEIIDYEDAHPDEVDNDDEPDSDDEFIEEDTEN